MDERRLRELPRKTGPSGTGPLPSTICQCCTYRPGVKCVQAQSYPCWESNQACTSSSPPENFLNKGPTRTPPPGGRTRAPTTLRLPTNVNQNIEEAHESDLILCQATPSVVFHPEVPDFSPNVLTNKEEWPALLASAETAQADLVLAKNTTPKLHHLQPLGAAK